MNSALILKPNSKMNVLYTSKICDDHPLHANPSGDGDGVPGRSCRLCSGDSNLRYFEDAYVWEGVEERYDQLLYDCFGVKVTPSDCMICERCVRALRNTERFRALVHAAFHHAMSDQDSAKLSGKLEKDLQPKKTSFDLAKRPDGRKRFLVKEAKAKRINISCEVCKQRYPMLVPNDACKTFICSRCKKNCELKGSVCKKCNIYMPTNMMKDHIDLHAKADLRAKTRIQQPKKDCLALVSSVTKQKSQKFQCSLCPKKYAVAKNLQLHVKNAHGDSVENLCSVCGICMETREKLEEHLADHSGLHQCDECLLIFKNKKTLLAHSLTHHCKPTTS